ncbi:hypothetical protein [Streptomyces sp. NPDC056399]|uniref:hypothetical protein n=1 Tax=Streptomyces sp. NPDC056399 TaxID=3345807 RepID=UPI0035DFA749
MTTPARPVNLPPQMCPPPLLGRCARCHAACHRYGFGGNPLCQAHQHKVAELQAKKPAGA